MYQGQIGGDFNLFGGTPLAGALSVDAIGDFTRDAVNVGTFTGTCSVLKTGPYKGTVGCSDGVPMFYNNTDVTATLSNNTGILLTAKYKVQALTVYGGYAWLRQTDPSNNYLNGFNTIGGWNVPATIPSTFPNAKKYWPTQWTNYTAYAIPRIAPFFWVGAKYAITPQLDVTGAFYYLQQSNYNGPTPCGTANSTFVEPNGSSFTVSRVNSGKCAGQTDFISAPDRLSAGQARRPLRRHNDLQRLWRLGERLPGGSDGQPDGWHPHQVLRRSLPRRLRACSPRRLRRRRTRAPRRPTSSSPGGALQD